MSRTQAIKYSQNLSVSDHNSIQCILNIPKGDCAHIEVTYWKLSEIDLAQLVDNVIRDNQNRKLGWYGGNAGGKLFNCIEQPSTRSNQSYYSKKEETMVSKWAETTEKKGP